MVNWRNPKRVPSTCRNYFIPRQISLLLKLIILLNPAWQIFFYQGEKPIHPRFLYVDQEKLTEKCNLPLKSL